jgi:antitoxin MazE
MKAQIAPWGNSLALRIPKAFLEELGIKQNDEVELTLDQGKLTITPIEDRSLSELLAQIHEENIHTETTTGSVTGKELW